MAEKPRLKETDEIFSSLSKKQSSAPSGTAQGEPEAAQTPNHQSVSGAMDEAASLAPSERAEASASLPSRRRRSGPVAEPVEDHRPLDFGKYTLPKRDQAAPQPVATSLAPTPGTPEAQPPRRGRGQRPSSQGQQPPQEQQPQEQQPEAKQPRRRKAPEPDDADALEDTVQLPSAKDLAAAILNKHGSRDVAQAAHVGAEQTATPRPAAQPAPAQSEPRSASARAEKTAARPATPPRNEARTSTPSQPEARAAAPATALHPSTPAQPEIHEYHFESLDEPFTPINEPDAPQPPTRRGGRANVRTQNDPSQPPPTRRDAQTAARVQADADATRSSARAAERARSEAQSLTAPRADAPAPQAADPHLFDPFGSAQASAPASTSEGAREDGAGAPEVEHYAPEREQHRENFLKRLSSQFDREFLQKFDEDLGDKKPLAAESPGWFDQPAPPPRRSEKQPRPSAPAAAMPLLPEEEEATETETERFIQDFEQQIRQEEQVRAESFKDTLAEKFERERQRYLRDLGIDPDQPPPPEPGFEPPEAAAPELPVRRRLDMQIQPDMHIGDTPRPVTYNRAGGVMPQEHIEEDLPYLSQQESHDAPQFVPPSIAGSKQDAGLTESARKLMELGAQNAMRAHRTPAPQAKKPQKAFKFKFSDEQPEADTKNKRVAKSAFRKIVAASTAAALLVMGVALGPAIVNWTRGIENASSKPRDTEAATVMSQDTETIYESRRPAVREHYVDVLIRRGNISVQNMTVDNHVVIGEIVSRGEVMLGDMTVGGSIYVQSCGVNFLQLRDVTASRVIINNDLEPVTVEISGNSSIGMIEMKTPGEIRQSGLDQGAMGVETVWVQGNNPDLGVNLRLDGIRLNSLVTIGDNAIALAGGAAITGLTSEGNLNLTGSGSVVNMSVAARPGESTVEPRIRDVGVANLLVKSPATLTLNSQVDTLSASDALTIQGGGMVGILTASPQYDGKRLPIELFDTNVGNLTANAQLVVQARGSTRIAALTANESVYALGNKVNHLTVNSENVIYENEPDKITTMSGVRPPSTVADNPNLDYSLSTSTLNNRPTDYSDDDVGTTCGHPRENGGFIRGDGSRDNPFEVSNAAQLAHVGSHPDSHFIQASDIDIASDSSFASGFTMIASGGTPFSGAYDGRGFVITGLRIRSDAQHVGLFAENKGVIRNLHIWSGDVQSTSSQRTYVGGIAGRNFDGGLIESSSNGATVSGGGNAYVGGITGYNNDGRIRDVYNYAKITGSANVGGIAGMNRGNASITSSYNAGAIDASTDSGAIAGVNNNGTITNSYFLEGTAAQGVGSGGGNVVEKTGTELSSPQMARDLAAGNDNSNWITPPAGGSYTFPIIGAPPQVRSPAGNSSGDGSTENDSSDRPVEVEDID